MDAPTTVHDLRLRGVLRLVPQQACIGARTDDRSPDRGIFRAWRGLVLVLRRRGRVHRRWRTYFELCGGGHRRDREGDLTSDDAVLGIEELAHEEHALREAEVHRSLSDEERKRRVWLEQRLDQCWDLLRQRRALIDAGRDPEDASVRGVNTVEHYQQ
jgi:hypothetical protein